VRFADRVFGQHHHDTGLPFDVDHMDLHVLQLADGLCNLVEVAPFASGELGSLTVKSAQLLEVGPETLDIFELQFRELASQLKKLV